MMSPTAAAAAAPPAPATSTVDEGREPSCSTPADADGPSPAAKPSTAAAVLPVPDADDAATSTPLGVLSSRDPSLLLGVLREAVARQKATLGAPGRHRCSPSVRSRQCAPHCLQILSARLFAVMCHDVASQRTVVDDDYVRVLVDALDPNHDPVSFTMIYITMAWTPYVRFVVVDFSFAFQFNSLLNQIHTGENSCTTRCP